MFITHSCKLRSFLCPSAFLSKMFYVGDIPEPTFANRANTKGRVIVKLYVRC